MNNSVVSINVSHEALMNEYNLYLEAKQSAIKKIYQEIGKSTRNQLRALVPVDLGNVKRAFKYRTTSTKNNVSVMIGIIKDSDYEKVSSYLNYLLYGVKPHWVSLKRHPELASWALRHGLITGNEDNYYGNKIGPNGKKLKTTSIKVHNDAILPYIEIIQKQALKDLLNKLENSTVKE